MPTPVRFALIGYGAWGSHHARAIAESPHAELAAIAARSEQSQAAARAAHPGVRVVADYRELLADPSIEAVDVVLPTDQHHAVGCAALAAGKHLLMEKPMAATEAECADLIARARQHGRLLAVGHELRLSSLWGKLKSLIEAGAIGQPQYALIELWRRPYRQGAGGWRYDITRVGNWILEEPIHFFDLARWYFASLGDPISVTARGNSRQAGHPELQDNFSAFIDFPGGAYAVISHTLSAFEHHQTIKLAGTKGALWATWSGAVDRSTDPACSLKHFDGETVHELAIARPAGEVFELGQEIDALARAIREGTPLPATGEDGLWSVALCLRAHASVESGARVPVQP